MMNKWVEDPELRALHLLQLPVRSGKALREGGGLRAVRAQRGSQLQGRGARVEPIETW